MAKISNEIHKWCARNEDTFVENDDCNELRALADRIDREMVELPQSAEGRIWTGREVCFWTGPANEDWHKFCGLHYANGVWCVEDVDWKRYLAASVWYERPDGIECIADELEELVYAADSADDSREKLANIAERIRRLAQKEDQR